MNTWIAGQARNDKLFRLEQRRHLAFRLDVRRHARCRRLCGGFPRGRGLGRGRLVRLVEERIARNRGRAVLALRAGRALAFAFTRAIEHVTRIADFTGFAPGPAPVVDAAARTVFLELDRLELDLALEQL